MNQILTYTSTTVFSIFIGSQITEGCLLLPHWRSMTAGEFHVYYSTFGISINRFYTCLTILAVLIPFGLSFYCYFRRKHALNYSIISSFFASLIIVLFYSFFKEINELFFTNTLNTSELKPILYRWEFWHWLRVLAETLSLIFLIKTFIVLDLTKLDSTQLQPTETTQ